LQMGANVFIEKPLALTMDGVAELVALAAERDLVAQVAAPLRYIDELEQMQENVQAGAYDDPVYMSIFAGYNIADVRPDYQTAYTARTGVLLDIGSHALDLFTWIMGPMALSNAWHNCGAGMTCDVQGGMSLSNGAHGAANIFVSWVCSQHEWLVGLRGQNRADRWSMPDNIDRAYYLEMAGFLESCAQHYTLSGNTLPQAERTLRTLLEAKAWPAQ
jgi:predicted dehydrogenase